MIPIEDNEDFNFFFWLGADGEAESVTEQQFEEKQCKCRKAKEDWINARQDKS